MYEFDGGHIKKALNITDPGDIQKIFFENFSEKNIDSNEDIKENFIIIFHCEFSQKRGPKMLN